ncbi:MAG: GGDEF domain-containing protein, partial [Chloroflexi bacterium]|nr:GGDEF domain-containing protein [Chloroflexota bacterium]
PGALEPAERELMHDFVDTIGIALENVRLYAEAAHLMITDSLTGVANRRRFDQVLEEEISRARRLDYPVGLLLIDIDRFKEYNDRHGHQAGDRILQAVAQALRASVRRTDLIARYGGEEFTAILPGTPVAGLRAVGEKLRQAVRAVRLDDLPDIPGVTVSIGGAAGTPPDLSADILVRAADMAQYLAKRAGGDRVHVVEAPPRT